MNNKKDKPITKGFIDKKLDLFVNNLIEQNSKDYEKEEVIDKLGKYDKLIENLTEQLEDINNNNKEYMTSYDFIKNEEFHFPIKYLGR